MIIARSLAAALLAAGGLACTVMPASPNRQARTTPDPAPAPAKIQRAPAPAPAPVVAELDPDCPVEVAGTTVAFVETPTGAAIAFTTREIAEVRARVDRAAQDHNAVHARMGTLPQGDVAAVSQPATAGDATVATSEPATAPPPTPPPTPAQPAPPAATGNDFGDRDDATLASGGVRAAGERPAIATHSQATVEVLETGVRLVFIARPEDLPRLRADVRAHAELLSTGHCRR